MNASRALKHLFAAAMVLVAMLTASASARADFFVGDYNGDHLIRRSVSVPNGQWLTVETLGCANGGDTVLFLLEGAFGSANAVTRGFNDDFNGTYCSYILYQNTSGVTKDFTIIVTTYSPGSPTDVQLLIQRTPDPRTTENVRVGGMVHRWGGDGSAEKIQTLPVRGANGGMPVDTVMFVINPVIGGAAKFDDDSGLRYLSSIGNNLNCASSTCWLIAGNYVHGSLGGNLAIWSQNAAVDADADGHAQILWM